ncbi:MAG: hypothetical protein K5780_00885 [Alphaproteobacteria bacterium]|nr:hypothetical protein [Alphaproteobacteria bacterium]
MSINKIVALAMLGGLGFFSVQAEENSNRFDGFYLGAGFGGNFIDDDDMTEDCNYVYTRDVRGFGFDLSARKLKNKKNNRVMGSLVAGIGKTFNRGIYAGLEGGFDLSKSRKHDLQIEHSPEGVETSGTIKNDGVSYSLSVRLGLTSNNMLVYFKPSIQFNKVSIDGYTNDYTVGSVKTGKSGHGSKNKAFALALGVERAFCNNDFSIRLEGEYVFPVTVKAESQAALNPAFYRGANAYQYTAKAKVRKMNIRFLGVYNVKF